MQKQPLCSTAPQANVSKEGSWGVPVAGFDPRLTWRPPAPSVSGALACYVAGEERVLALSYEDLDSVTPSKDFSSDVVARAHWFAQNGF